MRKYENEKGERGVNVECAGVACHPLNSILLFIFFWFKILFFRGATYHWKAVCFGILARTYLIQIKVVWVILESNFIWPGKEKQYLCQNSLFSPWLIWCCTTEILDTISITNHTGSVICSDTFLTETLLWYCRYCGFYLFDTVDIVDTEDTVEIHQPHTCCSSATHWNNTHERDRHSTSHTHGCHGHDTKM